jgi:hypothetical protein
MKELRCIVFSDREVLSAVLERRRRLKEPLPETSVESIKMENGMSGARAVIHLGGGAEPIKVPDTELQAALLAWCISRSVPMPVDAEKCVYLIRDHATLMITLNFKKVARLVTVANEMSDRAKH